MAWSVVFGDEFGKEFSALSDAVQDELLASARLLGSFGPQLGRPYADTLKGSDFLNMKELRFDADGGVWRVAFAFDPERKAILLIVADKSGVGSKQFYRSLIAKADKRYRKHLDRLAARKGSK
jgi:hypothetical protein